jgi:hypothetical protein
VTEEAKDAQEPAQTSEVAADDALEVKNAAEAPVLEILRREDVYLYEHVYGRDDLSDAKDREDRSLDTRKHRLAPKVVNRQALAHDRFGSLSRFRGRAFCARARRASTVFCLLVARVPRPRHAFLGTVASEVLNARFMFGSRRTLSGD